MKAILLLFCHGTIRTDSRENENGEVEYVPKMYSPPKENIERYHYRESVKCGVTNFSRPEARKNIMDVMKTAFERPDIGNEAVWDEMRHVMHKKLQSPERHFRLQETIEAKKRLPEYAKDRYLEPTKLYSNFERMVDKEYTPATEMGEGNTGMFLLFENGDMKDLHNSEDRRELRRAMIEIKNIPGDDGLTTDDVEFNKRYDSFDWDIDDTNEINLSDLLEFLDYSGLIRELFIFDWSCHGFKNLDLIKERKNVLELMQILDSAPDSDARGNRTKGKRGTRGKKTKGKTKGTKRKNHKRKRTKNRKNKLN